MFAATSVPSADPLADLIELADSGVPASGCLPALELLISSPEALCRRFHDAARAALQIRALEALQEIHGRAEAEHGEPAGQVRAIVERCLVELMLGSKPHGDTPWSSRDPRCDAAHALSALKKEGIQLDQRDRERLLELDGAGIALLMPVLPESFRLELGQELFGRAASAAASSDCTPHGLRLATMLERLPDPLLADVLGAGDGLERWLSSSLGALSEQLDSPMDSARLQHVAEVLSLRCLLAARLDFFDRIGAKCERMLMRARSCGAALARCARGLTVLELKHLHRKRMSGGAAGAPRLFPALLSLLDRFPGSWRVLSEALRATLIEEAAVNHSEQAPRVLKRAAAGCLPEQVKADPGLAAIYEERIIRAGTAWDSEDARRPAPEEVLTAACEMLHPALGRPEALIGCLRPRIAALSRLAETSELTDYLASMARANAAWCGYPRAAEVSAAFREPLRAMLERAATAALSGRVSEARSLVTALLDAFPRGAAIDLSGDGRLREILAEICLLVGAPGSSTELIELALALRSVLPRDDQALSMLSCSLSARLDGANPEMALEALGWARRALAELSARGPRPDLAGPAVEPLVRSLTRIVEAHKSDLRVLRAALELLHECGGLAARAAEGPASLFHTRAVIGGLLRSVLRAIPELSPLERARFSRELFRELPLYLGRCLCSDQGANMPLQKELACELADTLFSQDSILGEELSELMRLLQGLPGERPSGRRPEGWPPYVELVLARSLERLQGRVLEEALLSVKREGSENAASTILGHRRFLAHCQELACRFESRFPDPLELEELKIGLAARARRADTAIRAMLESARITIALDRASGEHTLSTGLMDVCEEAALESARHGEKERAKLIEIVKGRLASEEEPRTRGRLFRMLGGLIGDSALSCELFQRALIEEQPPAIEGIGYAMGELVFQEIIGEVPAGELASAIPGKSGYGDYRTLLAGLERCGQRAGTFCQAVREPVGQAAAGELPPAQSFLIDVLKQSRGHALESRLRQLLPPDRIEKLSRDSRPSREMVVAAHALVGNSNVLLGECVSRLAAKAATIPRMAPAALKLREHLSAAGGKEYLLDCIGEHFDEAAEGLREALFSNLRWAGLGNIAFHVHQLLRQIERETPTAKELRLDELGRRIYGGASLSVFDNLESGRRRAFLNSIAEQHELASGELGRELSDLTGQHSISDLAFERVITRICGAASGERSSRLSDEHRRMVVVPVREAYRGFVRNFLDCAPGGERRNRIEILRRWGIERRLLAWELDPAEEYGMTDSVSMELQ